MSYQPSEGAAQPVNNYMVWSIISLVITVITCCLCFTIPSIATAIVALVFSSKVNGALNRSDFAGAQQSSRMAKLWNQITLGVFAVGLALWLVSFFMQGGIAGQQKAMEEIKQMLEQQR